MSSAETEIKVPSDTVWAHKRTGEVVRVLYANEKFVRFRRVELCRRSSMLKRNFVAVFRRWPWQGRKQNDEA